MAATTTMANVAIFSIDYDGCGDLLFQEDRRTDRLKSIFLKHLESIAKTHATAEVYVGSSRQSISINLAAIMSNDNGSCFSNYEKLCAKKRWIFRRLLLADIRNDKPAGTAMRDPRLTCEADGKKLGMITHQLNDARTNHPNEPVDFYFFDDDGKNEILPGLLSYLMVRSELLENIRFFAIRHNWVGAINYGAPSIENQWELAPTVVALPKPPGQQPSLARRVKQDNDKVSCFPCLFSPQKKRQTAPPAQQEREAISQPRKDAL